MFTLTNSRNFQDSVQIAAFFCPEITKVFSLSLFTHAKKFNYFYMSSYYQFFFDE